MTEEQEKQNVRLLLFPNFKIAPDMAKKYLEDMDHHPEKLRKYYNLLTENLSMQYEEFKLKPMKELVSMAKERSKVWSEVIAPITLQEIVAMNKQWGIPVNEIIGRKITPELIKEMLDIFVIGQNKYKVKLSVAFFTYLMHQRRVGMNLPKCNLLVGGPSGTGKTYAMQILSQLFRVPFVLVHCNSVVQEGIEGSSLTDGFTMLLSQGWLKEEIQHAVVCFDEFDKLFEKSATGGESGCFDSRIVNEMLNIIDDKGEVEFKDSFDTKTAKPIRVPTRNMMFVFTGVFNGLRDDQTGAMRRIGFMPQEDPEEVVGGDDFLYDEFIDFGVKAEILGRVQNFVFLEELSEDDLVAMLEMGNYSPFNEFEQYFSVNGIDAILTDEAKHTLAKLAYSRKLGVRGLKSLLQQVLMEDMYDLDVGEDNVLKVTKQYILDNLSDQRERLLKNANDLPNDLLAE